VKVEKLERYFAMIMPTRTKCLKISYQMVSEIRVDEIAKSSYGKKAARLRGMTAATPA
jgi:hypothetical protein